MRARRAGDGVGNAALVMRRVIPDGVGMGNERLLIGAGDIPEAEQAARITEVTLVGGAGGAREDRWLAAAAQGAENARTRVGVVRRARARDTQADPVRAVTDDIVEERAEGERDRGFVAHGRHHERSAAALGGTGGGPAGERQRGDESGAQRASAAAGAEWRRGGSRHESDHW